MDYNWRFTPGEKIEGEIDLIMQKPSTSFPNKLPLVTPFVDSFISKDSLGDPLVLFTLKDKKKAMKKICLMQSFFSSLPLGQKNSSFYLSHYFSNEKSQQEFFLKQSLDSIFSKKSFCPQKGPLVFIEVKYRQKSPFFYRKDHPLLSWHQQKSLQKAIEGFLSYHFLPPHHSLECCFFLMIKKDIYCYAENVLNI